MTACKPNSLQMLTRESKLFAYCHIALKKGSSARHSSPSTLSPLAHIRARLFDPLPIHVMAKCLLNIVHVIAPTNSSDSTFQI